MSLPACASPLLENAGLGKAICRGLGQGANNELFLVSQETRRAVLKMTRSQGVDRLALEAAILQALDGLSAPRLLGFRLADADSPSCLLMEFAGGEHKSQLLEADATLLGHSLARLHSLRPHLLPPSLPSSSLQVYNEHRLISQLRLCEGKAPMPLYCRMEHLMDRLGSLLMEPIPGEYRRVLVHGDLIPLNMLWSESACTFIDWELARLDYAEWDFCALEKSYAFDEVSRRAFYSAYGRSPEPSLYRLVSLLYYANIALWRMASFYARGEKPAHTGLFLAELEQELRWLEVHAP